MASNETGVGKKAKTQIFDQYIVRYNWNTIDDRHIVTMED